MFDSNSCAICKYPITDPVCRGCYIKQTKASLQDLEMNSVTINFILNKVKNTLNAETLNDTECILCKKDNVSVCGYCFSVILTKTLKELNFTDDMIENFQHQSGYEENDQISFEDENVLNDFIGGK